MGLWLGLCLLAAVLLCLAVRLALGPMDRR